MHALLRAAPAGFAVSCRVKLVALGIDESPFVGPAILSERW